MKIVKKAKKEDTLETKSLLALGTENTKEYGQHVIYQRALPDFRDGLKPVHRRILWAMGPTHGNLNLQPNGPFKKVARVVGDVMGKFHPHGDSSIFGSLVMMAKSNQFTHNLIQGEGNFGGYNENPAAARYIECRMSKTGWTQLLNRDYLNIAQLELNYDGQEVEPVYLPSLLPFILLNGTYGIAVGSMGSIPPIHAETINAMVERYFTGKKVTADFIASKLKFNWFYGSNCIADADELKAWVNSGSGSLYFEPTHVIDKDKRTITFTDVPPFFNWDGIVKKLSGETEKKAGKKPKYDYVSDYGDYRGKKSAKEGKITNIIVKLKSSVAPEDFRTKAKEIVKLFTNHYVTNANVTHRTTGDDVTFDGYNIPMLFDKWMTYRIDLEVRMQQYRIDQLVKDIYYQNLLVLGAANKKTIFESLEKDKPVEWLAEKLEIEVADSKTILDRPTISWARISQDKVKETIVKLKAEKKGVTAIRDAPNDTISSAMQMQLGKMAA